MSTGIFYAIKHKTKPLWWRDSPKLGRWSWTATSEDFKLAIVKKDRAFFEKKLRDAPDVSQIEDYLNKRDFEIVTIERQSSQSQREGSGGGAVSMNVNQSKIMGAVPPAESGPEQRKDMRNVRHRLPRTRRLDFD